jgi:hypothetical protein
LLAHTRGDEANFLVRVDDEEAAHGERHAGGGARRVDVEHAVELRDDAIRVGEQRVLDLSRVDLVDVLQPLVVVLDGIDRQTDQLDATVQTNRRKTSAQTRDATGMFGRTRVDGTAVRVSRCHRVRSCKPA